MESGKTLNPFYRRIALARNINTLLGGALIAPWEVDELDESWQDAFRAWIYDGPSYTRQHHANQVAKSNWLANHPTYGKH